MGQSWGDQMVEEVQILRADLRKAVTDRSVLMTAMWSIARQADHSPSGLEPVQLLAILRNIELTALNTISEVEGKG